MKQSPYTIEDAKAYVAENMEDIMQGLAESRGCPHEIPDVFKKSPVFQEAWKAGCWLNAMLKNMGANDEEIHSIGFAHGQRCVFSDAWKWAVIYANEYAQNHAVKDKPGAELADQINSEAFARAGLKNHCN